MLSGIVGAEKEKEKVVFTALETTRRASATPCLIVISAGSPRIRVVPK